MTLSLMVVPPLSGAHDDGEAQYCEPTYGFCTTSWKGDTIHEDKYTLHKMAEEMPSAWIVQTQIPITIPPSGEELTSLPSRCLSLQPPPHPDCIGRVESDGTPLYSDFVDPLASINVNVYYKHIGFCVDAGGPEPDCGHVGAPYHKVPFVEDVVQCVDEWPYTPPCG